MYKNEITFRTKRVIYSGSPITIVSCSSHVVYDMVDVGTCLVSRFRWHKVLSGRLCRKVKSCDSFRIHFTL